MQELQDIFLQLDFPDIPKDIIHKPAPLWVTDEHCEGPSHYQISSIQTKRDFDQHVRSCVENQDKDLIEPFFEARIFMVLKDYKRLFSYEAKLQAAREKGVKE